MTSYTKAKAHMATLEEKAKAASDVMAHYPKGPMGLTPDEIKFSPQWRADRAAYQHAAKELREFTRVFLRTFAKEYKAERKARIEAMTRKVSA